MTRTSIPVATSPAASAPLPPTAAAPNGKGVTIRSINEQVLPPVQTNDEADRISSNAGGHAEYASFFEARDSNIRLHLYLRFSPAVPVPRHQAVPVQSITSTQPFMVKQ